MVLTFEEYANVAAVYSQGGLEAQIIELRAMLGELMAGKGGVNR